MTKKKFNVVKQVKENSRETLGQPKNTQIIKTKKEKVEKHKKNYIKDEECF